jgi:elongation factor Ts
MTITAKMVKELRDATGAGMMDCKKALVATEGDFEASIDHLRKTGIAKAGKKAGRDTKEGTTAFAIAGNTIVCVEVLCETDFVGGNEKFKACAKELASKALAYDSIGDITAEFNEKEETSVKEAIALFQENMQIRRAIRWTTEGQFGAYLHAGGKVGVVAEITGEISPEDSKFVAMHIAAFAPEFVQASDVPAEFIARETEIAKDQLLKAGKPENMIDKIIIGVIKKRSSEISLVEQPWINDDKSTFTKAFPKATVKRFIRWQVGEEL